MRAIRFRMSLLLVGIVLFLSLRAPAQTSLAETMATTEAQAELQAQTAEKVGPALEQQKQQADQTTPKAPPPPEKTKAPKRPEVEKAELVEPVKKRGDLAIALHHVSEHRFFYSAGLVALTLLVLLSTANQTVRRIAGSFCVVGVLFLLHYLVIGVWMPSLPAEYWRGPTSRAFGLRSVKEWIWVPEGNSVLSVVREKNLLGPKSKTTLDDSLRVAVTERVKGSGALEFGKGFVNNGIPWRTAVCRRDDGGIAYIWATDSKQQRIILILDQPGPAVEKDKSFKHILEWVKKIK